MKQPCSKYSTSVVAIYSNMTSHVPLSVSLGFFDDIFISPQSMQYPSRLYPISLSIYYL